MTKHRIRSQLFSRCSSSFSTGFWRSRFHRGLSSYVSKSWHGLGRGTWVSNYRGAVPARRVNLWSW